jgi:glycosyltransferase involved in cell wall biosynthesis
MDDLLRAMALLRERGTTLRCLLAGDGPDREKLQQLATELGLSNAVEFVGEVSHENVPAILSRIDIFAVPSTWEGFGVAAIEAAAMEIPVVASNIHGLPDVVNDGVTGLLIPPSNPEALAAAIGRLAGDPALRRRMGEAGRTLVEREYRWRDNARMMENLYDKMLGGAYGAADKSGLPR